MFNRTTTACTALVAALLVCAPQPIFAQDDNLLKDASFEDNLAYDDGGWATFEKSLISDEHARTGSRSVFNGALSRTVAYQPYFVGSVSGSFQEFAAEAGSQWQLTGYGMVANKLAGAPAYGVVQLSFFDAEGNDIGTVETADSTTRARTSSEVNNKSPVGEWVFLDTGVATAPEGAATVQAFTLYVDYSGSNVSQGVYFDDLTLCTIADNDDSTGCGRD